MTDERTRAALRELAKATGGETVKTATLASIEKERQERQRKLSELHDKMIGQLPGHVKPELSPSYMNSKYGKNWR
jgi:hypothetical protein